MNLKSRAKSFAKTFALVMSTSLSFAVAPSVFADENVPSVSATNASHLNQLFSKQWVSLGEDNSISGTLVQLGVDDKTPMSDIPVALVQNGQIAYSTVASKDGTFKFDEVKVGSYSLVVRTNESIAAFSLQVLDATNTHLSSSLEVRVVRPAGMKVKEILRSQSMPAYPVLADAPVISKDPLGESRSFSKSQFVKTDASGKLSGQLGSVVSNKMGDMLVYVLKDGQEVARAKADAEGKFSIDGLRPGVYGFVAAGASGFAATSFQLIGASSVGADGTRLISTVGDACGQMNVEVVQCCEVVVCEQPVAVTQPIVETIVSNDACGVPVDSCGTAPTCGCGGGFGGGGFGGGGFGGGGGGFGGGGIGGLAGLGAIAGLATVAGIVASNDNNNNAPAVSAIAP
jgi:uncharacterized membrane protein YgcG